MDLRELIRDVPDFPKQGIVFKDITPLLRDPAALREVVSRIADAFRDARPDVVAAIEARGFLWQQVRRMVAAALGVADGSITEAAFEAALSAEGEGFGAAPAENLVLEWVDYDPDPLSRQLPGPTREAALTLLSQLDVRARVANSLFSEIDRL